MLRKQAEMRHIHTHVGRCPFCHTNSAELWFSPDYNFSPWQVVCTYCRAAGPTCDCGPDLAIMEWKRITLEPLQAGGASR